MGSIPTLFNMYLSLIFFPFISFLVTGLFGKRIGSKGSTILSTSCLFFSFLISLIVLYEVSYCGSPTYVKLFSWISSGILNVDWGFMFDNISVFMCSMVTFISFLVHLYSIEYMSHDPHICRFMSYLSLFTFFMLILISADNLIQMFVGWEGVGLCSYLLINFWFTRIQANKAAIKAMLMNRVGDFSLLIGIFLIFFYYKSVDYSTLTILTPFFRDKTVDFLFFNAYLLDLIGIFLFFGAVGKSAQIGLHTWLPDAMEGPTPVSALIHAATMVTAGVFLLVRCSFLYEHTPNVLEYITIFGAVTAFFSATCGLLQNDLKRVIAYSTCSQLGYMVFACGLSSYSVSFFHLINHAFFKALLFLCAGAVIHSVADEQDIRKLGGLRQLLPFTYATIVIGSLALIGFPFLTGFYSKDLILESAFGNYKAFGFFSYILGTMGAFFTAFYSTRLVYLTFLSNPNGHRVVITNAFESGFCISLVLALLSIPSIFIGYWLKDMFVGVGSVGLGTSISVNSLNLDSFDAEFIPLIFKLLPVILSVIGVVFAFFLYTFQLFFLFKLKISFIGRKVYYFLNRKWFFDKVYNDYLGQFFFKFGYSISYKFMDRKIFEILGPSGLASLALTTGSNFHKMQTGFIYHYTLFSLIGVSCLFIIRQLKFLSNIFFIDDQLFFLVPIAIFFIVSSFED